MTTLGGAAEPHERSESQTASSDLVSWLRSQLDADERVARAASTDGRDGSTPDGEHWRWECTHCDTPLPITPVTLPGEFMECPNCAGVGVALRSVESYPLDWDKRGLSHFAIVGTEEQRPVDALHIQTHDPAHVLRTVAAHRAILDAVERWLDPHPGQPCDNLDSDGETVWGLACELHVQAR